MSKAIMVRTIVLVLGLSTLVGVWVTGYAGELEPPDPPAPTMVTLQEIDDKLDGLLPHAIGVGTTGITGCWQMNGDPVDCVGTGQDGEHQAGVSVNPRFTENGDGTVTDLLTGLIWLRDADCFGGGDWGTALSNANGLASGSCGLTDGSVAGDWRLPNQAELHSLIDYSQDDPMIPPGHPFSDAPASVYWSSTTYQYWPTAAWYVDFSVGWVYPGSKVAIQGVWPVRGGQ